MMDRIAMEDELTELEQHHQRLDGGLGEVSKKYI